MRLGARGFPGALWRPGHRLEGRASLAGLLCAREGGPLFLKLRPSPIALCGSPALRHPGPAVGINQSKTRGDRTRNPRVSA